MKRLILLAPVLLLASCGPTTPTIDGNAISIAVTKVKEYTIQICSFLPTDESVTSILTANAFSETAYAVAKAICKAVTATPTIGAVGNNTAPCPLVAGVCVEGQFGDPKELEKLLEDPIPSASESDDKTTKDQAPTDGTLNKEPPQ